MSEQPKPCPFCGQYDPEIKRGQRYYFADCDFVDCGGCGACGPNVLVESGAIEAWNTRPIEDALRAALLKVEWFDDGSFPSYSYCPWCGNLETFGHKPDCPRQVALGLAESA